MSGVTIERNIRKALLSYGIICDIRAYAPLNPSQENLRFELQRSGIQLIDAPRAKKKREKDVVDHMIITDMLLVPLEDQQSKTIVLISGDVDYAYPLARLSQRGYEIILIIPESGAQRVLKERADVILEWADIVQPERTTTENQEFAKARKYDPLISVLKEFESNGNSTPLSSQVEERLNERYPTWQKISGVQSFKTYVQDAKLDGWIHLKETDSGVQIIRSNEDEDLEEEFVLEDRYEPLVQILEEASAEGKSELELAQIGILLRKIISDPLDKLEVSQLKEYVLEAEEKGIVNVRHEGLQYYVSLKVTDETDSIVENPEIEETLDLLVQALRSLETDKMYPTSRVVIGRMREIKPGWDVFKSIFGGIEKLLECGEERRGIIIVKQNQNTLVFPPSGQYDYINPNEISEENFSEDQLKTLYEFFVKNSTLRSNGRYGLAKRLKNEELPHISDLSLGELTALVQLCVKKGWLQFRYNIIRVSDEIKKQDLTEK